MNVTRLGKFSFVTLLSALFPFLLLPVYLYFLDTEAFGQLAVFDAIIAFTTAAISFLSAGVVVEFYKISKVKLSIYNGNVIFLTILLCIIIEILVILNNKNISQFLNVDSLWLSAVIPIVFLTIVATITASVYQCANELHRYAFFILVPSLSVAVLTSANVVLSGAWYSKLASMLAVYLVFLFICLYYLYKDGYLRFVIAKKYINAIKLFSFPLLPHTLAASAYFAADRVFLSSMLTAAHVAVYAAGMQLALIMSVLQNALSKAWMPLMLEALSQEDAKTSKNEGVKSTKLIKVTLLAYLALFLLACVFSGCVYLAADFLLPDAYTESKLVAVILIFSYCFLGFYKTISPVLWHKKQSGLLSKITVSVFLINMFLNYALIPIWGVYGACIATIFSMFFQFLAVQIYVICKH